MGLLLPNGRYGGGDGTPDLTDPGFRPRAEPMTNGLAISLLILIVGGLAFDHYMLDSSIALFLSRQFVLLIDWMKFWA